MSPDERDRLRTLEVNFDHMKTTIEQTNETVTELRDLLLQAKGARWVIGIMIAVGSFMAGVALKYFPYLPLPR